MAILMKKFFGNAQAAMVNFLVATQQTIMTPDVKSLVHINVLSKKKSKKMKNKSTPIVAFSLLLFFGCAHWSEEEPEYSIHKVYYANGAVKSSQAYINDTIEHGTYLYYYPSGVLADSAQIIYGKFHGTRYLYHENGNVYKKTTYKNDSYRSGLTFREDGTLAFYRAYDYHENLKFIAKYGSSGAFDDFQGNLIHSYVLEKKYPVGKEFNVELLVATPANCKTEVIVGDWDKVNNRLLASSIYSPDKFNAIVYSRKQNPKEQLQIMQIAIAEDTISQISFSDTVLIVVDQSGVTSSYRQLPNEE